ncbi:hypothetical protein Fmac_001488 [Flemingia macrophylla]|uniref:Uncharacterized protein n=1 Tax=Flemingia macrophylla TaxID=520843 RepID=A0ABD1NH78_9FABA
MAVNAKRRSILGWLHLRFLNICWSELSNRAESKQPESLSMTRMYECLKVGDPMPGEPSRTGIQSKHIEPPTE